MNNSKNLMCALLLLILGLLMASCGVKQPTAGQLSARHSIDSIVNLQAVNGYYIGRMKDGTLVRFTIKK